MKKILLLVIFLLLLPLTASADFIGWPLFQAFDENGDPLVGGLVYTYNCGGVVAKTTYSDAAMTVANANPVVLNARGEADIYAAGCTHLVITTALGVAVEETDNYGEDYITIIEDADGDTQIQVEEAADEDIIRFDIAGTEQFIVSDGSITPTTDSDIDLGSTALQFANIYANTLYASVLGFVQRSQFVWVDDDTITISPGVYHHSGTSVQTVYWNSTITFECFRPGAGGSNANNEAAGTSEWHYIYLDDSAIVTQGVSLLDADCFLNKTDAPTYTVAKHGWYHGSDRCIFAILTDATDDIVEFWHDGGDFVQYCTGINDFPLADPGIDYATEVTLTIPSFSQRAEMFALGTYVDNNDYFYWRNTDMNVTGNKILYLNADDGDYSSNTFTVTCNSSLKIDVKQPAGNNTLYMDTVGWYFPNGI